MYYIPPDLETEIWAYLDHREKDGYSLRTVDVFGVDSATGREVVVQRGVSKPSRGRGPNLLRFRCPG